MFEVIFNQLILVMGFIGNKILTIQIANISLIYWIMAIIAITVIIKFVYDNAVKTDIGKVNKSEEKETERYKDTKIGFRSNK